MRLSPEPAPRFGSGRFWPATRAWSDCFLPRAFRLVLALLEVVFAVGAGCDGVAISDSGATFGASDAASASFGGIDAVAAGLVVILMFFRPFGVSNFGRMVIDLQAWHATLMPLFSSWAPLRPRRPFERWVLQDQLRINMEPQPVQTGS